MAIPKAVPAKLPITMSRIRLQFCITRVIPLPIIRTSSMMMRRALGGAALTIIGITKYQNVNDKNTLLKSGAVYSEISEGQLNTWHFSGL